MANKKKEILLRAYLGFLLVFALGVAILGRAFYIQTSQGAYYRELGDSLTIEEREVLADRGNIYSSDGSLLATTLPTFDIRIDFKTTYNHSELFTSKVDSVSMLLARMFPEKTQQQYKNELLRERKKKNRYYLLKRNISYEQLSEMKKWPLFRDGQYKSGLVTVQNDKRMMPFGLLAQRTIGFINESGTKVGLEGKFDEQLRGEKGLVKVQKIAGGVSIPLDAREQIVPQPGKDIYTTIDINLQDVAEDALYRALQHHQAEHGSVVLMEVATGRIKAIANLGLTKDSAYAEIMNYAVGEATEPGSTFKLATIACLMEDGLVTNDTKVFCGDGIYKVYNKTIRDHEAPETPELTVKRGIEVSSNVLVANLADKNYNSAKEKFYSHLEDFGFTKPMDIEIPGAGKPVLHPVKDWSGVSCAYIAHGYEVQLTPLHILNFYNTIANNGVMVKPHIVEKIKEYNRTVDSIGTVVIKDKVLSEHTLKQLREILEGVVQEGTAENLKTDYLHVAGKTGTAVIAQGNQGYRKRIYQASFCGYFPAEAPQYSMIVVINSPGTNGYYGNVVAGSIFKEVADKVYSLSLDMHSAINKTIAHSTVPVMQQGNADDLKHIYQFFGLQLNAETGEWARVNNDGQHLMLAENDFANGIVPDVTGMGLRDALYLLESMGMKVSVVGKGIVRSQSITPGTRIQKGMMITVQLKS